MKYLVLLMMVLAGADATAADVIEFADGAKLVGTITSIRKAEKEFDFEPRDDSTSSKPVYRFDEVFRVSYQGKWFVLTPKSKPTSSDSDAGGDSGTVTRSKAEVLALIEAAGKSPPDWFESTPLDYPKTLDLSWPIQPPKGPWQSHKNMGQYIWSVVNENPGRWHSGIKLLHHCVSLHKDDRVLLQRDMNALGDAYFRLLQDYPRAAFWFQQGKATVDKVHGIRLAECYWRLGNRDMALQMLRGRRLNLGAIKLYGDMGEIDRALSLTAAFVKSGNDYQANILAADALRLAGRPDEAIDYYQRVIASKRFRNDEYEKRFKARAQESIDTIRLYDQADVSRVADGTYRDSSTGYNGKLSVAVTVSGGRLEAVKITDHKEKQFYSSLTDTPEQLIARQSVQGIDGTSSATITSQAIVNATAKALAQGTR
ncbi:FMN-binding protein [Stieleria sp. ICT_E10.1]|uniref:FMN-binding protein n=1 Tax=Stieleria sedimenti TaxID=2976331 RepID=UPI0021803C94|nr:FMN-binding protein [Stieleria sedimenti]MCS7465218.1 FMN-binding protein [Stieleria sedimenti]